MTKQIIDINKINYDILIAINKALKENDIDCVCMDHNVKDLTLVISRDEIPEINITYVGLPIDKPH